ncbi:MAG: hypothetical protein H0X73_06610 [Chthoniobacterales bacterium]|nr:hypothetical protein [Chthoniobacterales bacterium]
MTRDDDPPLWQYVVGDTEPWRRGRLALIIVGILTVLVQAFTITRLMLPGFIEAVAVNATLAAVFWLQFYFIWIGVHWVRWLQGAVSICYGFAMLIWGFVWGATMLVPIGVYSLLMGSYIGFAPAVYFFAVRQRERRDWRISLAVGAVFILLVSSLAAFIFGLARFRLELETKAHQFADGAFKRIFVDHDTYFLIEHSTKRLMSPPYGRAYLSAFLQDVTMRAGEVREISRCSDPVLLNYHFPGTFFVTGEMHANGMTDHGPVMLRLGVGGVPANWEIDQVGWFIPDPARRKSSAR